MMMSGSLLWLLEAVGKSPTRFWGFPKPFRRHGGRGDRRSRRGLVERQPVRPCGGRGISRLLEWRRLQPFSSTFRVSCPLTWGQSVPRWARSNRAVCLFPNLTGGILSSSAALDKTPRRGEVPLKPSLCVFVRARGRAVVCPALNYKVCVRWA